MENISVAWVSYTSKNVQHHLNDNLLMVIELPNRCMLQLWHLGRPTFSCQERQLVQISKQIVMSSWPFSPLRCTTTTDIYCNYL